MDYQYCVILREGPDAGIKQYFWADKKTIDGFFNNFRFGENIDSIAEMGHIVGQKKGEVTDKIHFTKRRLGSLVFECKNEETANKCAGYWKFSQPFNHK